MLRVNLRSDSSSSEQEQKMVYMLAMEMSDAYKMPRNNVSRLLIDHGEKFCNWVSEEHGSNVTVFEIGDLASGFEFHDDAFVTAMLLKTPAGSLI